MGVRQRARRLLQFLVFLTFPITLNYFSPYLVMEGSSQGIAIFSLFLWAGWALAALAFGRAGCGYVCPLGAAQTSLDAALQRPLKRLRRLHALKYVLAAVWVGGIAAAAVYAGGYRTVDLLYNTESGVSVDSPASLITYYAVLLVALLPAVFLGKRGFCHYFCPFSVLNIVGTRIKETLPLPSLRLEADADQCAQCGLCSRECPMSLDVQGMVQNGKVRHTECLLCGTCVDGCPRGAIRLVWKAIARGGG